MIKLINVNSYQFVNTVNISMSRNHSPKISSGFYENDCFVKNKEQNFTGLKHVIKGLYKNLVIKLSPLKVHLTKYDTERVLAARIDQLNAQHSLQEKFGVISTDLIQTEERKLLRLDVVKKLLKDATPVKSGIDPELYITMGLPGSGKSSVIEKPLLKKIKAVVLDKDDAKEFLPEYKNGKANYVVCDEADDIIHLAFNKALESRFNLVMPNIGTVYEDVKQLAQTAKDKGYKVHLRFVEVDKDVAAQRAINRFQKSGRFTETLIHEYLGDKPKENYTQLFEHDKNLFETFAAYSNDVPKNDPPIFIKELSNIEKSEV
ncbi:MAG: zeta toxin family protein [bacterium]